MKETPKTSPQKGLAVSTVIGLEQQASPQKFDEEVSAPPETLADAPERSIFGPLPIYHDNREVSKPSESLVKTP